MSDIEYFDEDHCQYCGEKKHLYKDFETGLWLCELCLGNVFKDDADKRRDE